MNNVDDDFDELFEDDEWEDNEFESRMRKEYPGWYLVKLPGFTARKFEAVKEWLNDDNIQFGQYSTVGWSSNCSYSVGVVFESGKDAMIFKIRWR